MHPGDKVRTTHRIILDRGDGHGRLLARRGEVMTVQDARARRIPDRCLEPHERTPRRAPHVGGFPLDWLLHGPDPVERVKADELAAAGR